MTGWDPELNKLLDEIRGMEHPTMHIESFYRRFGPAPGHCLQTQAHLTKRSASNGAKCVARDC